MADPLKPRQAAEYVPSIRDKMEELLHVMMQRKTNRRAPMTDFWLDRYPANWGNTPSFGHGKRINQLLLALDELRREQEVEGAMRAGRHGFSQEPQAAYNEIAGRSISDWIRMNPNWYKPRQPRDRD